MGTEALSLLAAGVGCTIAYFSWNHARELKRAELIRTYRWPRGLLDKLSEKHPGIALKDAALVSRGLRQFFIAYLMSDRKYVSMPSQIVDDLWHEFILYTREYEQFCKKAFGGFMHHTPAVVMDSGEEGSNEGLRRVWWYACKDENIDPKQPTRLPLLFALDGKLQIPNGYRYNLNCEEIDRDGATDIYCTSDFTKGFATRAGFGTVGCGGGDGGHGGGCGSGCGSGCGGGCGGG